MASQLYPPDVRPTDVESATETTERPPAEVGPVVEVEPAKGPVEAAAPGPGSGRGRRAGGGRWAVALAIAVVAIGLGSAALFLAAGSSPVSRLAGWVPAGTVAYAEVRLDAPGDQSTKVADLLSRFPGFADRSRLDAKLTELADRLVGNATGGKVTYSSVKPWLGDAVAAALTHAPSAAGDGPFLAVVATKDPVALRTWLAGHAPGGATTESYAGTQLTTGTSAGRTWAYAVMDTVMVAGDPSAVRAAIDTKGGSGFPSSDPFRTASGSVGGAGLGFGFIDTQALAGAAGALAGAAPSGSAPSPATIAAMTRQLPPWFAFSVRAQSDALEVGGTFPKPSSAAGSSAAGASALPTVPAAANATSSLAAHLPADTIVALESRDLGPKLVAGLAQLAALRAEASGGTTGGTTGGSSGGLGSLSGMLSLLQGSGSFVGWMGDGTLAIRDDGGTPSGGVVAIAADPAAAATSIGQLRALLAFAGSAAGISVRDEPYGGGTITIVDLGDAASIARTLQGLAGSSPPPAGALPNVPTAANPLFSLLLGHTGRLQIALTAQNGLFVAGVGDGFVKAVLDTQPGSSLGASAIYRAAIDRVGASNAGQAYLDIPSLTSLLLPTLSATERATYERDLKPFIDPLGAVASATLAGDPMRVQFVVTVK